MASQQTMEEKEKKNQEYNEYVKRVTPTHSLPANMVKAFVVGGIICVLGQFILNMAAGSFNFDGIEYLSPDCQLGRRGRTGADYRVCQFCCGSRD